MIHRINKIIFILFLILTPFAVIIFKNHCKNIRNKGGGKYV